MEVWLLLNCICRRIRDIILQHKGNLVLELQQRSIEFNSIIEKHQNIRYGANNFVICHINLGMSSTNLAFL